MGLKEEVKRFPDAPGVYFMKDAAGRIIYIGKAVCLKKRVQSYFARTPASLKTQVMMGRVRAIDYESLESEHEALLREAELIKFYEPPFNIVLKDDKSFPYIKITQEDFPRVTIARRRREEAGADYFGPYTDATRLRQAVKILRKAFPFCSCRRFPKRPCLRYHLGLCPAPCCGKITKRAYRERIRRLEDFLAARDEDLIADLGRRMRALVKRQRFEEAARIRDQLEALTLLIALRPRSGRAPAVDADFRALGLKRLPRRIEAFDISNLYGRESVGSMVSFWDGRPDKDNYRRFRIRTVEGVDDYAMMREVVRRRYARLREEGARLPDLILIDGGPGHLAAAAGVLEELGVNVAIIAIAKKEELIYTKGNNQPLRLGAGSPLLRLIQRARDEAHRFALRYHRLLRGKNAFEEP
ncbi:MAG: excinuclease ABC subunit UvrC [Deltaproteobacteria bacterium]